MQVETFLERSAAQYPNKAALICGDHRTSYALLERSANALAHALLGLGVSRGDRVAVYLSNSIEAVISVFGILKASAAFVMVDPSTKADKLEYILEDAGVRVLVSERRRADLLNKLSLELSNLAAVILTGREDSGNAPGVHSFYRLTAEGQTNPPSKRHIDIDLAALIYTSGSTGEPKGVALTHLNMVTAAQSIVTYIENSPTDVILNALPLSFDYGLYQVLMSALVGATVVLERSFAFPAAILSRLVRERVTGFPIVPTMAAILTRVDLGKYDLSSLRYVTSTGAPLPAELIRRMRKMLPHVRVYSMYGLTECKRVAYLDPGELDGRPMSVGKAMPNVEAYIVDEQGCRITGSGCGELVVRGANVMAGYWNRPQDTERVFRPGPLPNQRLLLTGDIFRVDEEGFFYFVGRKDDMIKCGGRKVSPREVENVLYYLKGVVEAAVIGLPDDTFGEVVVAFVVPEDGCVLTAEDVRRHCASQLEDHMVPARVEFRSQLPKTWSGKIDKTRLRYVH